MKKWFALILALCVMAAVFPAAAESAGDAAVSEAGSLSADRSADESSIEGKIARLISLASALKEKISSRRAELRTALSALKGKARGLLSTGKENIESVLSGLKSRLQDNSRLSGILSGLKGMLSGGNDNGPGLLDDLFGGIDDLPDGAPEDESYEDTIARLNKENESEFGDSIPGKKEAESLEEFFGDWTLSRMIFGGEETDLSDSGEGIFLGQNIYRITENGEESPDNLYKDPVEMRLEKGVMKVLLSDLWTTVVLTESGELVMPGGGLILYFVPAGK